MTNPDDLLAAILADPANDDLRLVYADLLDDRGEGERSEFIRVQVELARIGNYCQCDPEVGVTNCEWCHERRPFQAREMQLFSPDWLPDFDGQLREWYFGEYPSDYRQYNPFSFCVSRGFIAEVRLSCDDWLAHGPALVRRQPIERVVMTDRKAQAPGVYSIHYLWGWIEDHRFAAYQQRHRDVLPQSVWANLSRPKTCRTESAALDALSAAALLWARQTEPATV